LTKLESEVSSPATPVALARGDTKVDDTREFPIDKMRPIVYALNGPNLNLLGTRQSEIYGRETLADVEAECRRIGADLGLEIEFHQTNAEFQLIDWSHESRQRAAGIVINPEREAAEKTRLLRAASPDQSDQAAQ
jgi:hypothetical protein